MNSKFNELITTKKIKQPRSVSRKHLNKSKLPKISHNHSSSKLPSHPSFNPLVNYHKKAYSIEHKVPLNQNISFRQENLRSNTSMEEDLDKLDMISSRNNIKRNDYLSIQQRLIEIASNSKLNTIKEFDSSVTSEKRLNAQVDKVIEKYHNSIQQKLKLLQSHNFIL